MWACHRTCHRGCHELAERIFGSTDARRNCSPTVTALGTKKARIDGGVIRCKRLICLRNVGGYRWTRTTDLGIMSANSNIYIDVRKYVLFFCSNYVVHLKTMT
jgi:hypothetical protein